MLMVHRVVAHRSFSRMHKCTTVHYTPYKNLQKRKRLGTVAFHMIQVSMAPGTYTLTAINIQFA
jgi:hypothetical protein